MRREGWGGREGKGESRKDYTLCEKEKGENRRGEIGRGRVG